MDNDAGLAFNWETFVWIIAQVYEKDLGRLRTGSGASVTSDAFPNKVFRGSVRLPDLVIRDGKDLSKVVPGTSGFAEDESGVANGLERKIGVCRCFITKFNDGVAVELSICDITGRRFR